MAVNRNTFLRLYEQIGPYWGRVGYWGRRFYGTWSMVLGDFIAEAARQTSRHRLPWEESPLDSLTYLGADRGLPRYPSESEKDYRNRIAPRDSGGPVPSVWDQHEQKVSPGGLREQLLAAGYDVEIVEASDPTDPVTWADYGLRIHGFGELPCTPHDWDLPPWDSGWAWDTQMPAKESREIRDVCLACAPTRCRITSLHCPDLEAIEGLTLAHRWRADNGVTTASGSVTSWEDSIAGAILEPSDAMASYPLDPTDVEMGNRATIRVDEGMTTSTQIGPATDWTAIVICYPDDMTANPPIGDRRVFELTDSADSLGFALEHYDSALVTTESAGGTESTGAATTDGPVCYVVTADHGAGTATVYRDGVALATVPYTAFAVGGVFGLGGAAGAIANRLIGRVAECALAWQTVTAEQASRAATYALDYYGSVPYSGDPFESPWKVS